MVGIGVGCGALTAYSQLSVQNYESSQNIAVASHRVFNLATCVTKVCASYLYHNIYKHERGDSEFSRLEAELTRLQDEERQITLRYNASGYTDMEAYRREGDDVRERILAVADRLASSKQELLSRVHTISAEAFRDLCMRNRGVYIKLGQHLSQLDYILPPEYCSVLSDLLDKNPASNFESVCSLFQEEFPSSSEGGSGALPADLFASFDPVPIASASLAQVHVATGRDGQRYAVKVQHPSLRRQAAGDLVAIARALEFVSWVFPSFKYQWLLREMTNNLPVELDFCHEAANMERCRSMLHKEILVGDVVVPTVAPELSSSRVLTMSFEDGVSIGGLSKKFAAAARGEGAGVGYRASDVAQLVSSVFAEQIFRHGFVHCDPHEANLHVRAHPTRPGRPQLILLDHGLYRELGPDFRHHYTRLWSGVAGSDFSTIERECGALHVTSSVSLFSALLTMKPWSVVMSNDMNRYVCMQHCSRCCVFADVPVYCCVLFQFSPNFEQKEADCLVYGGRNDAKVRHQVPAAGARLIEFAALRHDPFVQDK